MSLDHSHVVYEKHALSFDLGSNHLLDGRGSALDALQLLSFTGYTILTRYLWVLVLIDVQLALLNQIIVFDHWLVLLRVR